MTTGMGARQRSVQRRYKTLHVLRTSFSTREERAAEGTPYDTRLQADRGGSTVLKPDWLEANLVMLVFVGRGLYPRIVHLS